MTRLFGPLARGILPFVLFGCLSQANAPQTRASESPTNTANAAVVALDAKLPADAGADARQIGATGTAAAAAPATFYPLYEGACGSSRAYRVGNHAVHRLMNTVWSFESGAPRIFFRDNNPFGIYPQWSHLSRVGGVDDSHAWVFREEPLRNSGYSGVPLFAALGWKKPAVPESGQFELYFDYFIEQPDGSLWHKVELGAFPYGESGGAKFMAWSPDGKRLSIHLPGKDMAGAVRLPTGELVGEKRKAQRLTLKRWSPTHPVDDLSVDVGPAPPGLSETAELGVAGDQVVIAGAVADAMKKKFFFYDGSKLTAARLNSRDLRVASWAIGADAQLFVLTAEGDLVIERLGGEQPITSERQPEPGQLRGGSSAPWFIPTSGSAVYARSAAGWVPMALPDGPWTKAGHAPQRIEWLEQTANEVLVSVVRTDAGFGRTRPNPVRTVYSSIKRAHTYRCGAPFDAEEIAEYLPPQTAACEFPVLVVGREVAASPAGTYPNMSAAIQSRADLKNANLELVNIASSTRPLIAIRAPSIDLYASIIAALTPVMNAVPEAVCAPKDVMQTLHFDAKAGRFAK